MAKATDCTVAKSATINEDLADCWNYLNACENAVTSIDWALTGTSCDPIPERPEAITEQVFLLKQRLSFLANIINRLNETVG